MLWIILFLLIGLPFAVIPLFRRRLKRNWIVVDGSNVLYWERETPALATVSHVIGALRSEGYDPVVWFDANVGYLIGDRYMGAFALSLQLGLSSEQVRVAPKGTPADPLLLKEAGALGARVVTNDRYRDWEDEFPQVREAGFLIRGFVSSEEIGLDFEHKGAARAR